MITPACTILENPADGLAPMRSLMAASFDPYFREAWSEPQLRAQLGLPGVEWTLLLSAGSGDDTPQPTGFTLSRWVLDEEELLLIAIAPATRGQGLGRALLQHWITAARARGMARLMLEMRTNNPARQFYLAAGFLPVGIRKDYYRCEDGLRLDAISFARDLA